MSAPPLSLIIADDDTERVLSRFTVDKSVTMIRFSGPDQNFDNDLNNVEKLIGHKLNPLIYDFYTIALAVYIADLQNKKNPRTGCRTLSILLAVSDLNKWIAVKQKLEATLRFLSGDSFRFYFVQSSKPALPYDFEEKDRRVVSLFSGGLDSLSGVAWLLANGLEPILVSHAAKNTLFEVQRTMAKKIEEIAGKEILFGQISARPKLGKHLSAKEYSEPCRSFLYLTLGMTFALELGVSRMFVFENGVMALNIPLTPSRIYLSTRTTHPIFLRNYSELITAAFDAQISIENPFLTLTKAEAVAPIDSDGFLDLVKESCSCSTGGYRYLGISTNEFPHCGICLPCIARRIALNSSRLWSVDSKYAFDICAKYDDIPEDGKTLIHEILDFGHKLERCRTDNEAIEEFPQFLVEDFDPVPFIAMYRRQVVQTKQFLRQRAHPSLMNKIKDWL